MALMPVGFSIFLAKGFVPAITSEGRVVNASLFVIVVIIIGVQWVILNLAALLHRGIRHALREASSAGRCRQQRHFLVSSCLPTSVFGCYDNQQGTRSISDMYGTLMRISDM